MWCSAQTDPLWDGSDLSSLWCSTLPLVNSTLCPLSALLYCLLSLFLSLCVQSSSRGSLTDKLSCVFCLYSWLLAIHSKTVRFLFRLCIFTFCSCAWSSLFGVIISAQGVATCPPLNGASLLRRFVSSVTSWMKSSSIVAIQLTSNLYKSWLIPSSVLLPLSGAISAV